MRTTIDCNSYDEAIARLKARWGTLFMAPSVTDDQRRSTTVTGGLANPLLSFLEDAIAIVTFILAVLVPLLVVAMLGLTLYLASRWLSPHRATVAA